MLLSACRLLWVSKSVMDVKWFDTAQLCMVRIFLRRVLKLLFVFRDTRLVCGATCASSIWVIEGFGKKRHCMGEGARVEGNVRTC